MTPVNLMDALAGRLQKLLADYSANQPAGAVPISVYPGYVPVEETSKEKPSFLYVLVTATEDKGGNDLSTATVEIGFSIYDEDPVDGWRSLFNVIERVRQDLLKYRFVNMKHRLVLPVAMKIAAEQPWPQWQATMSVTYTIGQPEEEGMNFDDFQEVQAYPDYEEYKNH